MPRIWETAASNDNDLKQAVLAELAWEPRVTAAHVGVTASAGVVTLTGHVENYGAKNAAENAVGRVRGVRAVVDELEVRLPSSIVKHDDEIAAAALDRFSWAVSVPTDAIRVAVEKGWVTLTGAVDWYFQKESAVREVRDLSGVVGITDRIAINPRVDVGNISDDIALALRRSWYSPKTVTVSADGGKIILAGTASTWRDRSEAEATAWAAPGATSVENHIGVI